MADEFAIAATAAAVSQMLAQHGFHMAEPTAVDLLGEVALQYVALIAELAADHAENHGRSVGTADDLHHAIGEIAPPTLEDLSAYTARAAATANKALNLQSFPVNRGKAPLRPLIESWRYGADLAPDLEVESDVTIEASTTEPNGASSASEGGPAEPTAPIATGVVADSTAESVAASGAAAAPPSTIVIAELKPPTLSADFNINPTISGVATQPASTLIAQGIRPLAPERDVRDLQRPSAPRFKRPDKQRAIKMTLDSRYQKANEWRREQKRGQPITLQINLKAAPGMVSGSRKKARREDATGVERPAAAAAAASPVEGHADLSEHGSPDAKSGSKRRAVASPNGAPKGKALKSGPARPPSRPGGTAASTHEAAAHEAGKINSRLGVPKPEKRKPSPTTVAPPPPVTAVRPIIPSAMPPPAHRAALAVPVVPTSLSRGSPASSYASSGAGAEGAVGVPPELPMPPAQPPKKKKDKKDKKDKKAKKDKKTSREKDKSAPPSLSGAGAANGDAPRKLSMKFTISLPKSAPPPPPAAPTPVAVAPVAAPPKPKAPAAKAKAKSKPAPKPVVKQVPPKTKPVVPPSPKPAVVPKKVVQFAPPAVVTATAVAAAEALPGSKPPPPVANTPYTRDVRPLRLTGRKMLGFPEQGKYKGSAADFYCVCGRDEDFSTMVGCDGCTDWYHLVCLGYPDEQEAFAGPNIEFFCPKCLTTKPNEMPQIDWAWKTADINIAKNVLKEIKKQRRDLYDFFFPLADLKVDRDAEGHFIYNKTIALPMALEVVEKKLQGVWYPKKGKETNRYPSLRAFHADMIRIVDNCRIHWAALNNPPHKQGEAESFRRNADSFENLYFNVLYEKFPIHYRDLWYAAKGAPPAPVF